MLDVRYVEDVAEYLREAAAAMEWGVGIDVPAEHVVAIAVHSLNNAADRLQEL